MKRILFVLGFIHFLFLSHGLVLYADYQINEIFSASQYGSGPSVFTNDNLCGVKSVHILLSDFGIKTDFSSILKDMPPSSYGNSMEQIVNYLKSQSTLKVTPVRFDANSLSKELLKNKCKAIANVNDHWVVIRDVKGTALEIVDFPRKYYMPVEVLDRYWEGHTIVVSKSHFSYYVIVMALATVSVVLFIAACVFKRKIKRRC